MNPCPVCKKPASGMYCQACGCKLMPEPDKVGPQMFTEAEAHAQVAAAVSGATMDLSGTYYRDLLAENDRLKKTINANAAEATHEYQKLAAAHDALKAEMTNITLKHEAIAADTAEKSSEAYLEVVAERDKLLAENAELKAEIAKAMGELAHDATATLSAPVAQPVGAQRVTEPIHPDIAAIIMPKPGV